MKRTIENYKELDWIDHLKEIGPSCEVGVGNINRIWKAVLFAYRQGIKDARKEKEMSSRRYKTSSRIFR